MILEFLLGHLSRSQVSDADAEEEPEPILDQKEGPQLEQTEPRIIYFDLETQKTAKDVGGWHNTHLMGVSVAVIFDSLEKSFFSFTEDEVDALLAHLQKASLVIGFNIRRFDYTVLSAYTGKNFKELNTFDILEDIYQRLGFRLALDHLAQETLNQAKTADGLQAVEWFKNGEMDKLIEYCRHDVAITRDLFQHGLNYGQLVYRTKQDDTRLRLLVNWDLEKLIG
jgi:DEAD/DEAH box helicase domain-containing protein